MIRYLSKALNYVMKDAARVALAGQRGRGASAVYAHLRALEAAARAALYPPVCAGLVPGQVA